MKLPTIILLTLLLPLPTWGVTGDLDRDGDDLVDSFLFADNFGSTGPVDDCGDEIATTPLTFTGDGTQTTTRFQLETGLRVIRVSKTPSTKSIFVEMLDGVTGDRFSNGGILDIDDKEEVSKSFQVEETNTFVINVDTGAEWAITLDSGDTIPSVPSGDPISFSGEGTQTTGRFTLESGLRVIRATKTPETESIFITVLDGVTGDRFPAAGLLDIDDKPEISKSFSSRE